MYRASEINQRYFIIEYNSVMRALSVRVLRIVLIILMPRNFRSRGYN